MSDAMVPLVARAGFRWMATDEEILARSHRSRRLRATAQATSSSPKTLYRAVPRRRIRLTRRVRLPRSHDLGSHWVHLRLVAARRGGRRLRPPARRGRGVGTRPATGQEATVFVILDGENAWEHYEGQGRPFLRALYGRLASHPELRTVTMSEACADASETLPSIFPGSWINADFYIWIGHADDHRAWSQLADARRALDAPPPGIPDEALARAREEMLIAEGSDWFWWYGDDHSSDHDLAFDDLFRRHVRNVYRALDAPIPEELFVTNITTQPPSVEIRRPTGFIQPDIDGEVTSYFEWVGAGSFEATRSAGAMHQVGESSSRIVSVEFGFDLEHLFIRVDGGRPMRELLVGALG